MVTIKSGNRKVRIEFDGERYSNTYYRGEDVIMGPAPIYDDLQAARDHAERWLNTDPNLHDLISGKTVSHVEYEDDGHWVIHCMDGTKASIVAANYEPDGPHLICHDENHWETLRDDS